MLVTADLELSRDPEQKQPCPFRGEAIGSLGLLLFAAPSVPKATKATKSPFGTSGTGQPVRIERGSSPKAQYVRLAMQSVVKDFEKAPERMQGYVDLVLKHRAWVLMNKPDGATFASWEEFCGFAQPWGLGKPWTEIRPVLEAAHGKRTVQLAIVPDATPPKAGPGRGHKPDCAEIKQPAIAADGFTQRTAGQLRAINRAPDTVKEAYREGRISQTLAAKLGPKNPTPEVAAKVAEVAGEIRKIKDRKEVDRVVRDRFGQRMTPPNL